MVRKAVSWGAGGLLLLAVVLGGGGMLLPATFSVSRGTAIAAPPEKVYGLVADPRAWRRWSVWNRRDPAMRIGYSGPPSGAGAAWEWQSTSEGNGRMTFTAAEPNRRVAFDLYFADFGTTSRGELALAAEAPGTRVTWTLNGDMGRNPLLHWMTLVVDRTVGSDFETSLANLKTVAETH